MSAWRNQLLEILGAMGIREMRRLRGEVEGQCFLKTWKLISSVKYSVSGYEDKK